MKRLPQPLAPSTVAKLRDQADEVATRTARRPVALFVRISDTGVMTRAEKRWRAAEARGYCRLRPMRGGVWVELTPYGEGYLTRG